MIGIYERVSSKKQDTASQHQDLAAWAEGKEFIPYEDKFTGKTMNRPGFNRLLSDIRSGKIKTLVVWRLDRLGRTASGLTSLFDELIERKVNFISLRDGIDLATAAGRLLANVLASVAAFETEVRGERIAAGLEAKRAKGEKWNNGRPAGTPDKLFPSIVQAIKAERQAGTPVTEIAKHHRLSRQTVYIALSK